VVMITECSMADNVQAELPDVEMVKPCNLCPHMKRITLQKIFDSLLFLRDEVVIDPVIAERARRSVERMINLKKLALPELSCRPGESRDPYPQGVVLGN
jgi:quinolinate synthase